MVDRIVAALILVLVAFAPAMGTGQTVEARAESGARLVVAGTWAWPLPLPHAVTRAFEAPQSRFSAGHRGIDIAAAPGSPVYAAAPGEVSFVGVVVDRPLLSIVHSGDLVSSSEPVQALVAEGEHVRAGQQIGIVATGGHCSMVCLHFGVRLHGQYVSPMLVLGGIQRAVLLPLGAA
jgi:murein DD-endopeptidase MepM/ murein hydrolase activator NlpD